jgi:RND family efflux transporter MFP subunit
MMTPSKYVTAIFLGVGLFFAGYMAHRPSTPPSAFASTSAKQVLYYTCPMHPHYKSDRPGDAPCCGMRLVAVTAAGLESGSGNASAGVNGSVQIGGARQQLIGVRTGEVKRSPASHLLRVPGRIAVDESRSYRLVASADGWIRSIGPNTSGAFVKHNQILATYYTANLVASQQAFLFALATVDQVQKADAMLRGQRPPVNTNLQSAIDTLRGIGMNDLQIKEIEQTQKYATEVKLHSPVDGFVLARNVTPEQRFEKGAELYRIADITHVWVISDIFERDRELLRPGTTATVRYQGRELHARMSDALPQFDAQSRTLKTRFEVDNPGLVLRPDMFVDVEIQIDREEAVTVPADAVIDTGRSKSVFVECGPGCFAPRTVKTGWRLGDRVQIMHGLEPGERIVISGNFLIDSESRMNYTAVSTPLMAKVPASAAAAEVDPVCGMTVDPKAPKAIRTEHGGKTYYFCSEHCRKAFEANPGKYTPKKMSAQDIAGMGGPA